MIVFVKGTAASMTETSVIVENGGIGYEIFMTFRDLSRIRMNQELTVHTYFHVKEDGMQLYGFFSKDDLSVFRLLLTVSGIGPKGALGILGVLNADDLRFAVLSDDVKKISSAPGIGKKTAQKLILELRDKLNLSDAFEEKLQHEQALLNDSISAPDAKAASEAIEALTALGYSPSDARKAVRAAVDAGETDVEMILKAALKYL